MGTNYYAYESYPHNPQHIGKNSWGWVFHFQSFRDVNNLSKMRDYLKDKAIYDEYNEEFSLKNFWEMVEKTKEPMPNGEPKYILTDGTSNDYDKYSYEESGYAWSTIDFS